MSCDQMQKPSSAPPVLLRSVIVRPMSICSVRPPDRGLGPCRTLRDDPVKHGCRAERDGRRRSAGTHRFSADKALQLVEEGGIHRRRHVCIAVSTFCR